MLRNIILLEDDPARIREFHKFFADENILVTDSADFAIYMLQNNKVDIIFLDHDLCGAHYSVYHPEIACETFDSETGYAVAKWLAERPEKSPDAKILIHTMNKPQAKRMRAILHRTGGRYPEMEMFGTEKFYSVLRRFAKGE